MKATPVVSVNGQTALGTAVTHTAVVSAEQPRSVVVVRGVPGPPGDPSGALLIDNRLNEFAGDTAAQEQAQANLGLGVADPLAYYILAKS